MLSDQRQYEMTEYILREGKAGITELAERFGISGETVRRDLNAIARGGQIRKVHGGAVAIRHPIRDKSYSVRQTQNTYHKQRIGEEAASLICDHDLIGIDAGTCAEGLARALHGIHDLTVVTPSFPVAAILTEKIASGDLSGTVLLPGGVLEPETRVLRGGTVTGQLRQYRLDKVFLSATAVSEDGIMTSAQEDGILIQALLRQGETAYVLAESEKLNKQSFFRAAALEEIRGLITDDRHPAGERLRRALTESGCELRLARLTSDPTPHAPNDPQNDLKNDLKNDTERG